MIFLSRQNCTCSLSGPRRTGANAAWPNCASRGGRQTNPEAAMGWIVIIGSTLPLCMSRTKFFSGIKRISFIYHVLLGIQTTNQFDIKG
jgi:hypothetical protein